jgi:hypothetical protein
MDIKDAFFKVELEEESRPLTAFTIPDNHYQYTVAPQGERCSSDLII